MADFDFDHFTSFVAEVDNELQDVPLRAAIDSKIRHFFKCFDAADWEGMEEHLSVDDPKLLDFVAAPTKIHANMDVLDFLINSKRPDQVTAHHLLLVDRGRVTCYVSHFSMIGSSQFNVERNVYIIDLDGNHRIKRIERRAHKNKDYLTRSGDLDAMQEAAADAEDDAMKMDHSD
ncbi:hypothetical protein LY78DRAFT_588171 [Colletotrichum sublineola]|uniref:SnoaL-like domain-containing protein n=1 Tax=Colletotrichum sublineola TaxID=1173701 RepID=A0A066XWZ6_COLSU|nr:hypothetical protein LY78DRAFT_588171 [Colletotrichum sublineola]KDN72184.1 hypothetical protein CSUB01_10546 [Colletotrichum sublineola]